MDEILKTLYLHLDTNTSYLLKNAECQLLVKLVYKYPKASVDEIYKAYKRIVGYVDQERFDGLVEYLLEHGEIEKRRDGLIFQRERRRESKKLIWNLRRDFSEWLHSLSHMIPIRRV